MDCISNFNLNGRIIINADVVLFRMVGGEILNAYLLPCRIIPPNEIDEYYYTIMTVMQNAFLCLSPFKRVFYDTCDVQLLPIQCFSLLCYFVYVQLTNITEVTL